jgi:hypothetical protein
MCKDSLIVVAIESFWQSEMFKTKLLMLFVFVGWNLFKCSDKALILLFFEIDRSCSKRNNYMRFTKNNLLSLPFISDRTNRKIKKAIFKSKLPLTLVNLTGRKIKTLGRLQHTGRCSDCNICDHLPESFYCQRRHLVYSFKCKLCGNLYIGQTNRCFKDRFHEHERSISKNNNISALSEHLNKFHPTNTNNINNFVLNILDCQKDSIATTISESLHIKKLQPKINRKDEMTVLF